MGVLDTLYQNQEIYSLEDISYFILTYFFWHKISNISLIFHYNIFIDNFVFITNMYCVYVFVTFNISICMEKYQSKRNCYNSLFRFRFIEDESKQCQFMRIRKFYNNTNIQFSMQQLRVFCNNSERKLLSRMLSRCRSLTTHEILTSFLERDVAFHALQA